MCACCSVFTHPKACAMYGEVINAYKLNTSCVVVPRSVGASWLDPRSVLCASSMHTCTPNADRH